jgi:hypothetical protein
MIYQVKRTVHRVEYGTIEAESHQQAAHMLRANMWDDCVQPVGDRDRERIAYQVNGLRVNGLPQDQ